MAWNIADLVEHVADTVPDRVAIIYEDEPRTFSQLDENATRLAHTLAARGVKPGDHVGIYGYNSHAFVETILAAYKLRAVPINVNYRYVEAELRYLFDNADLVAIVHDEEFGPRIDAVRESLPMLQFTIAIGTSEYDDALTQGSPDRDFPERSDDDIYILYTGGTTGMPKGVVWRQEDVLCVLGGLVDFNTGVRVEDEWEFANAAKETEPIVSVIIAPLMHGAAQWGVLNGLLKGTTSVMLKKFDADEVWKAVDKYKIMTLSITGDAMGRPLIEALEAGDYDASSLVTVASTAALFSATLKEQYLERFPNLIIADAVGSTESGYNGVRVIMKGSEERPGPPTIQMGPETVVLDDDLNIVQPGSGVVGRMARGGHVPLRYHKDPEKSAATFVTVEGKRYSIPGDFARVEADGSMTLLGRGSVSINSGGEKIYPEEVEAALKAHDAVFDALVVGVPDERWGQRVAAVVELRPGYTVTLEELDVHARDHIAGYKVPRELHLVDKIERSPSGKPDYPWATRVATSARQ